MTRIGACNKKAQPSGCAFLFNHKLLLLNNRFVLDLHIFDWFNS